MRQRNDRVNWCVTLAEKYYSDGRFMSDLTDTVAGWERRTEGHDGPDEGVPAVSEVRHPEDVILIQADLDFGHQLQRQIV